MSTTSTATYVADLERRLAAAAGNVGRMERLLIVGSPMQKVEAAGKLVAYRHRYRELSRRLDDTQAHHGEKWGAIHTELAKDIDAFTAGIERFLLGDPRFE
jgi:hypothetical protein